MATHLDLEEQEQLDEIKHFWKQYGNTITWVLIIVLAVFASWNGYQFWQKKQALQAAAMLDEVEKVIRVGDTIKIERAFGEMKERFSSTAHAQQAGLMVGKAFFESGKIAEARSALVWVVEKSGDAGYVSAAKLRLASLLLENKSFDDALKALDGPISPEFGALAADRRGDIFAAQGKTSAAIAEYLKAYKELNDRIEYRRLVEVKLNALGVTPGEDGK